MSIEQDESRFKNIVKGAARKNLKKLISNGGKVVKKGDKEFTISMPNIEIPRFKFGNNQKDQQKIGQGDGEAGDKIGKGNGDGEPGDQEGQKQAGASFTPEELAEMLGEELELPKIEPKGSKEIAKIVHKYNTLRNVGPNSLINHKQTYKSALKRLITEGDFDEENPIVIPRKKDFKYRSYSEIEINDNSAVVIYMMDVSGSMGDLQKEMARNEAFWLNTWIKSQYKKIKVRFVIHDTTAKEVNEKDFFTTTESGGTMISSAYTLVKDMITKDHLNENIYVFQFSDGDNWNGDSEQCIRMIHDFFSPVCNLFCYAETRSRFGSGMYGGLMDRELGELDNVITSSINSSSDIPRSIKEFLGKGK